MENHEKSGNSTPKLFPLLRRQAPRFVHETPHICIVNIASLIDMSKVLLKYEMYKDDINEK